MCARAPAYISCSGSRVRLQVRSIDEKDPKAIFRRLEWDWTMAHLAAACGQDEVLLFFFSKNPRLLIEKNLYGQTPMHYAAANGQVCDVKTAIVFAKDPKELSEKNVDGQVQLHCADTNGQECNVAKSIEHGT